MEFKPLRFIGESVAVDYQGFAGLEKRPLGPLAFTWNGRAYRVLEVLSEWVDYRRRGRFARNMQPQHAEVAAGRGSWGVGRFYYYVRIEGGQVYLLYYDRAPKGSDERKGSWTLVGEYQPVE